MHTTFLQPASLSHLRQSRVARLDPRTQAHCKPLHTSKCWSWALLFNLQSQGTRSHWHSIFPSFSHLAHGLRRAQEAPNDMVRGSRPGWGLGPVPLPHAARAWGNCQAGHAAGELEASPSEQPADIPARIYGSLPVPGYPPQMAFPCFPCLAPQPHHMGPNQPGSFNSGNELSAPSSCF